MTSADVPADQHRPRWMAALAVLCVATVVISVLRDLFWADSRWVEVWFGFEVKGWPALLTAPLHWAIFAVGAAAFWRGKAWVVPWAAGYLFYVALSHLIWSEASPHGRGWPIGLLDAVAISYAGWMLLRLGKDRAGALMLEGTPREIHQLVDDLDRGRQAWINGRLEETATTIMAQADDMTIFGPFGGDAGQGGAELAARQARAVALFRGGTGHCELVNAIVSGDLVVLIMMERNEVQFAGAPAPQPWVLRTTQVFRRDGERWIRLHRHADPLVRVRPLDETLALCDAPRP